MLRSALPLACLAACLLPGVASAAPSYEVEYEVGVDVTATWSYAYYEDKGNSNTRRAQYSASTRITGKIADVLFQNGRLVTPDRAGMVDVAATGSGMVKATNWNPMHNRVDTEEGSCTAGDGQPSAAALKKADPGPDANREYLDVRIASQVLFQMDCTKFEDFPVGLARPGMEFPDGTFDVDVALPLEAIGMGKIIENVSAAPGKRSPHWCPGAPDPNVTDCELNWSGALTFTKTFEHQLGIESLPGQKAPEPFDDDLLVPIVPTKPVVPVVEKPSKPRAGGPGVLLPGTAKRVGGKLVLSPTCPSGCRGFVTAGGKKVAFRVAAGAKARRVAVKLPAVAFRAKKVRVTLMPTGGKAVTKTVKVG